MFMSSGSPGNDTMVIKNNGNVGIGTGTPNGILDINKNIIIAPATTGTGATDRANIQGAINAVHIKGGGTVILQAGTYKVDKVGEGQSYAIELKDKVHLCGASSKGTTIQPTQNDTTLIILDTTAQAFVENVIKNLRIFNDDKTGCVGIWLGTNNSNPIYSPQPSLAENLVIEGTTNNYMNIGIQVSSWFSKIHNCNFNYCTTGIRLEFIYQGTFGDTNASTVEQCRIWGVSTGVFIRGAGNKVIHSNIGGIAAGGNGVIISQLPCWV